MQARVTNITVEINRVKHIPIMNETETEVLRKKVSNIKDQIKVEEEKKERMDNEKC